MRDRDLYTKLLGIEEPWYIKDVEMRLDEGLVEILIAYSKDVELVCPVCGASAKHYDTRKRTWRHLDTMQFKTLMTAEVPRVECRQHGVKQVPVLWAEAKSRFTAMFESLVIDWLKEASLSGVARILHMTWAEVDGIQQRAVTRGKQRREARPLGRIGIDETSFQKRHEYVTVIFDTERKRVLEILDGRTQDAIEGFFWDTPLEHLQTLKSISMDMWKPYIQATLRHVPDAANKIAFDRFHVAKHLGDGVNKVRAQEHLELSKAGKKTLAGTRFLWLQNPENMSPKRRGNFEQLRRTSLRVARAWSMKETARSLWSANSRSEAKSAWLRLADWMSRSRLQPMVKVARTIRRHLWGIVNAITLNATNADLESVNAKIQALKKRACGFRNRDRFRDSILFHCGDLDLYPRPALTHSIS